jgi:hypothetical protein
MQKNIFEAFNITYQGSTKILRNWLKPNAFQHFQMTRAQGAINFKEIMDSVTGSCLSAHFKDLAPEYPSFSIMIRKNNREQAAQAAIRQIAGLRETQQGTAVLDALELMDGSQITTDHSKYTKTIKSLLSSKPEGQVCNHNEILIYENGLSYMDPEGQRLESEWVVVVLAAMVYAGDIMLAIPGKKFDATNLRDISGTPMETLTQFKHIEKPKDWNTASLRALFELFNIPPGTINALMQGNAETVQNLQVAIDHTLDKTIQVQQILRNGFSFWKTQIYEEAVERSYIDRVAKFKGFLDSLGRFNTIGKLKNFDISLAEIKSYQSSLELMEDLKSLKGMLDDLSDLINWLSHGTAYKPFKDPWVENVYALKQDALATIRNTEVDDLRDKLRGYQRQMESLKGSYIREYLASHRKARLDAAGDQRKAKLINDVRFKSLDQLAIIDLLPQKELLSLKEELGELKSCFSLKESDLQQSPICKHCTFNPNQSGLNISAEQHLNHIDAELDRMLEHWKKTLLENLSDPIVQENLALLNESQSKRIKEFLTSQEFPIPLDQLFIHDLQEVLSGLEKVPMKMDMVREALRGSSGAATPQEIKQRFIDHVDQLIKGKDPEKVRIVIEKETINKN